jgi:hypothetical protein
MRRESVMKKIQKLILPFFIGVIVLLIYFFYFSPQKELGSFEDYDPFSHVQKDIVVKLVHERGIQKIDDDQNSLFYVEDRRGTQMPIQTKLSLPEGFANTDIVILTGHICEGNYELVDIEI